MFGARWILLVRTTALAGMLLVGSGCGTAISRVYRNVDGAGDDLTPVYPATTMDAGLMTGRLGRGSSDVSTGKRVGAGVLGLFDLPFSLAFDTLFLPYDLVTLPSH